MYNKPLHSFMMKSSVFLRFKRPGSLYIHSMMKLCSGSVQFRKSLISTRKGGSLYDEYS